jgi:hypothetical protein
MTDEHPSSARREALMVWLKLIGLLVVVFLFGLIILELRKAL